MNSFEELIVVAGPTASGKTSYAIELAKELNAVLINADSMQVYKDMNIGTNKGEIKRFRGLEIKIFPRVKLRKENIQIEGDVDENKSEYEINAYEIEKSGVVGYMFDIVNPDEEFTLAQYQYLVLKLLEEFNRIGQKAILVGGTGLYIDSILKSYKIEDVGIDENLRHSLIKMSNEQLFDELYKIHSETALSLNESDKENPRRLIRRIELAHSKTKTCRANKILNHKIYYPIFDREDLYDKINNRVEEMFEEGLIEEVKNLVKRGFQDCKSMQGMGYKEVVEYLNGKISLEEAKTKIKQAHRNYASRQITWFENKRRGYNLKRVRF
ncbi:tRNA dimethylallyltransferase [Candidatus Dojkabacteria bacterium]|uniref:tRNA dimethylallyltransferase n=1 Tax=Candidatus Dojkabacteria bacterium TaxID=2099670 RepID=A0A955IDL8_9BACT|nr:tRNA dimethylallyltransferase [Candidatus Dojkabacteria bacterium]